MSMSHNIHTLLSVFIPGSAAVYPYGVVYEYYIYTSGTPEICLLPAGMADKNKLVLYLLYQVLKEQNNNGAVRQCSSTYGSKAQRSAAMGTVYSQAPSGRPVL